MMESIFLNGLSDKGPIFKKTENFSKKVYTFLIFSFILYYNKDEINILY